MIRSYHKLINKRGFMFCYWPLVTHWVHSNCLKIPKNFFFKPFNAGWYKWPYILKQTSSWKLYTVFVKDLYSLGETRSFIWKKDTARTYNSSRVYYFSVISFTHVILISAYVSKVCTENSLVYFLVLI